MVKDHKKFACDLCKETYESKTRNGSGQWINNSVYTMAKRSDVPNIQYYVNDMDSSMEETD